MDLEEARRMARSLMNEHGLTGWAFQWSRAKRVLGSCEEKRKLIRLSVDYVRINEAAHVRDTVLHEIAHALAGCRQGHGEAWKRVCRRIGANPERVDTTAALPEAPYQIYCPGCEGVLAQRHRRPKEGVMDRMYCRACGRQSVGSLAFRKS